LYWEKTSNRGHSECTSDCARFGCKNVTHCGIVGRCGVGAGSGAWAAPLGRSPRRRSAALITRGDTGDAWESGIPGASAPQHESSRRLSRSGQLTAPRATARRSRAFCRASSARWGRWNEGGAISRCVRYPMVNPGPTFKRERARPGAFSPPPLSRPHHRGLSGFLTLSQPRDGPDLYGAVSRFDTMPSKPDLHAWSKTVAPSSSVCPRRWGASTTRIEISYFAATTMVSKAT
jgi:hypothetical protein